MSLFDRLQGKANEKIDEEKAKGKSFLEENKNRPEVTETASGLQYEVLTEGNGDKPTGSSRVTTHYTGSTLDGKVFDSSLRRGQPLSFGLNQVIPGWTEGLQLMSAGSKYKFYIPSNLAYGDRGAGADIPGGATLVFEVELLDFK